jgi:two-component system NtrC family sensor kinase
MKIRRLRIRIVVSFFVVIAVFAFSVAVLGFYMVKIDISERAQAKVKNDLNSAREIYRQETENVRDVVRFTAVRFFIKDAIAENDREILAQQLELIRKTESLDILTLTDKDGKVIVRARNPAVFGDSRLTDKLVGRVLSDKKTIAGTVIVSRDELLKEGQDLAERAYVKFTQPEKAKSTVETEQTSGMMIKAASPIFGHDSDLIGVLYGGNLLNRNYRIVDKIKGIVYQGAQYEGKDLGAVTLFQQDVRISTNVRAADGNRTIGTRISEQVYERVLEKGIPWIDRAFVVTDWYKTAYEPIKNIDGRAIGILYVGTLEEPFVDMARNVFLVFLAIVLAATLLSGTIALVLSHNVSRPLTEILKATENPDILINTISEYLEG